MHLTFYLCMNNIMKGNGGIILGKLRRLNTPIAWRFRMRRLLSGTDRFYWQ